MAKKQQMKHAEQVVKEDREESSDEEMEISMSGDWTTINFCTNDMKHYIVIEPWLNDDKLIPNGFINRAFIWAGLKHMLCSASEEIYPIVVFEFLGYLDTEKLTTKVTYIDPRLHTSYFQEFNLLDFATNQLRLKNEGEDVMNAWNRVVNTEFRRYSVDKD